MAKGFLARRTGNTRGTEGIKKNNWRGYLDRKFNAEKSKPGKTSREKGTELK